MELPLVVGVDGSEGGTRAVDWAAAEAGRSGLPLRLVHASLWEHYEGVRPRLGADRPAEQIRAENLVAAAEERANLLAPEVKVSTAIEPEDPVTVLLREAREATLLVLGPRGHGPVAGMLLGSVSLAVAARARCPVTVVRGEEPNRRAARRRVVLGVGGPVGGADATRFAFREARWRDCELVAVRAWRRPVHKNLPHPQDPRADEGRTAHGDPAREYRRQADASIDRALAVVDGEFPDVVLRRRLVEGTARRTLLDETASADLLVVGAKRRHPALGPRLSRLQHALLHHAACPVTVVPATD
ncbi:universal stress protein [Streptomyces lushanensis]|uniref:universal stress protein n=1 Tax=Streptomyces lushanensis TaxID=1434255 RepID=UPI00082DE6E9|nr:universal stress protein [Streptomyces lushanensis]